MIEMKQYIATFGHQTGEHYVHCDGIGVTHAQARAWIKFMGTSLYKNNKDSWALTELKEV